MKYIWQPVQHFNPFSLAKKKKILKNQRNLLTLSNDDSSRLIYICLLNIDSIGSQVDLT